MRFRSAWVLVPLGGMLACSDATVPVQDSLRLSPHRLQLRVNDTSRVAVELPQGASAASVVWSRSPATSAATQVWPDRTLLRPRIRGIGVGRQWVIARYGRLADSIGVEVTPYRFDAEKLFAGGQGACALADGVPYCWGGRFQGEFPDGAVGSDVLYAPAPVQASPALVSVVLGAWHACGLTAAGAAHCWGVNTAGAVLGSGPTAVGRMSPTPIEGGLRFRSLTAGEYHTCGITEEGEAYCWGSDRYGQLGLGDHDEICQGDGHCAVRPTPVVGGVRFASISAGAFLTCGLTADGKAYCWGINDWGQLGIPSADSEDCGTALGPHRCSRIPVAVAGQLSFQQIAPGADHTCALALQGDVYCWGHGEIGQLGDGTTASRFPPKPIAASSRFVEISNTCARTSGGAVHCWGQNDYGQAGPSTGELCQAHDATFNCVTRPQAIQVPAGVTAIEQGAFFACALVASGAVYCWGSDDGGKLGTGQLEPVQNPSPLRVVGTGA